MGSVLFSICIRNFKSPGFDYMQHEEISGLSNFCCREIWYSAKCNSPAGHALSSPCQSVSVALSMNHWIFQAGRDTRKDWKGSSSPISCSSQGYVKLNWMTKNIIQTVLEVTVGLHLHLDSFTLTLICRCRTFCAHHFVYQIIYSLGKQSTEFTVS